MAWVTIWASSMAARARLSQLLLLRTSTKAWIRRNAFQHTEKKGIYYDSYKSLLNNATINSGASIYADFYINDK